MKEYTLADIKARLRAGAYAWPGGYPLYFITDDGAALSFAAVRAEWRQIVWAHLTERSCGLTVARDTGWHIAGCEVNWEDEDLFCDHTGERIESAYGEDAP